MDEDRKAWGEERRWIGTQKAMGDKDMVVGSDTTISLSDLQIGTNLAADYQEVFKNWHVHELVDKRLGIHIWILRKTWIYAGVILETIAPVNGRIHGVQRNHPSGMRLAGPYIFHMYGFCAS